MGEETHNPEALNRSRKRKTVFKRGKLKKKKQKQEMGFKDMVKKIDPKMKKFLRKKARDYNSDDDGEEEEVGIGGKVGNFGEEREECVEKEELGDEVEDGLENDGGEEEEDGGIEPGIARFSEGCRAFRIAFLSIMKKCGVDNESLGPVLAGHKKLVVEKLAEEVPEKKAKGEKKKEKHWEAEKGHEKPNNYLDSQKKFLIGVATKGVVKLFNAVNKAQHAQKGLNPSRMKDAKVIKKRRKEAFFSELSKAPTTGSVKNHSSSGSMDIEGPSWAPLRDNYMLTNSKLENWDKMPDTHADEDVGKMSEDSSSDDD